MTEAERAEWLDLAERYHFLYRMPLQERLAEMRQDVADWWWFGGFSAPKLAGPPLAGPTRLLSERAGPSHASVASDEPRRSSPPPTPVNLAEARLDRERVLPPAVKEIIRAVSAETGVKVADIMSRRAKRPVSDARRECYRRLRKMPWLGGRPSLTQIGLWLGRDHTTVQWGLKI